VVAGRGARLSTKSDSIIGARSLAFDH